MAKGHSHRPPHVRTEAACREGDDLNSPDPSVAGPDPRAPVTPDADVPAEVQNVAAQRASSLRAMFPTGRRPDALANPAPALAVPPDTDATIEILLPGPESEPVEPVEAVEAVEPVPTGAEPRARGGWRSALVAGVVTVAFVAGGLTAYQLGTRSGNGEPVHGNDTRVAPLPTSAASDAERSPSGPPSHSPSASPTRRSTAPSAGTTKAPPPPAKPPDLSGPLDGTGTIIGIGGQCLDNQSSKIIDGNPIQSWVCDQSPAQVWTAVNGRYTVQGKCLAVKDGSRVSGTSVVLWTCDGSPGQQWQASAADSSVRNPASGLCLTTWDRFTPAVISTCVAGPGQKWTRG